MSARAFECSGQTGAQHSHLPNRQQSLLTPLCSSACEPVRWRHTGHAIAEFVDEDSMPGFIAKTASGLLGYRQPLPYWHSLQNALHELLHGTVLMSLH